MSAETPSVPGSPTPPIEEGPFDSLHLRADVVTVIMALYVVVLGLAVSDALTRLTLTFTVSTLLASLTMFTLVLPFFHGGMMFMYRTYVNAGFKPKGSAFVRVRPLVDSLMLFASAIVFYVMSALIVFPAYFVISLLALFVLDVIWVAYTIRHPTDIPVKTEWTWLKLDLFMIFVLALSGLSWFSLTEKYVTPVIGLVVVLGGALARTFVDYWNNLDEFFPERITGLPKRV